jgi:signal transduction histidine kinase
VRPRALDEAAERAAEPGGWVVLAAPGRPGPDVGEPALRLRRVLIQVATAAAAVLVLVALVGSLASRRIAEDESVHEVAQLTDVLAQSVLQPALTDAMATSPAAARAGLDSIVRNQITSSSLVRVKLWTPSGQIVYSDEPRIIGQDFGLDSDARSALTRPETRAEVSDLSEPENQFERGYGKLLEVYRPVWTPSGQPLLFETYFRYDVVSQRSSQLWHGFVGIMLSCLATIFVLLLPLVWTLLARARRAHAQREAMMRRAVAASDDERRRIAATLHDGIVQQLAAASFAVAGGAAEAAGHGDDHLATTLDEAAASVRAGLGGMRSLLVDIYPPSLRSAGLGAAVRDLAATMSGRDPVVLVEVDDAAANRLPPEQQQAVFRVAQEALRNAVRHSGATAVSVRLVEVGGQVTLTVADDGAGFHVAAAPAQDHFGLRLMTDAAVSVGAELQVSSRPGAGAAWLMRLPG